MAYVHKGSKAGEWTGAALAHAARCVAQLEAQEALKPGYEGWWPVWGASPYHIKAGDIVALAGQDPFYVDDVFQAKAAPMRVGLVIEGRRETLGGGCRIILWRWGTHNTLAD